MTPRRERRASFPQPRRETLRESLRHALLECECTLRDLSIRIGIGERDVAGHLEHLERSLRHSSRRLVVEPCECLACGYRFPGRHRFTRPSRCPECRGERISASRFRIDAR